MEKEIAKRFLKGIPASPGIVIGKACVFQDILYLVERRNVEEGHAEQEIVRLKQAIRQVIDELIQDNLRVSQEIGRGRRKSFLLMWPFLKTLTLFQRFFRKFVKTVSMRRLPF